uniref:Retinoic acid receptor responder protein 2 n=1 Tax=Paramormyrops kingsleyae TaxID=1676925 RepID=A0A3B3T7L0_9TELE
MEFVLLIALFVPALLAAPEGEKAYNKLSKPYRDGVDLAVQQVNSHSKIQQYFFFFKSMAKTESESGFGVNYIYHNFYLKPTTCTKSTQNASPKNCPFRNDRPMIDCAVCYRTVLGVIDNDPNPYIHCIHKPSLSKEMIQKRAEHYRQMTYSHGAPTLLASKGQK